MAVDMEQVRAALEPEEPDYPRAAKSLGADALPHLERIITGDHTGLAAKAAYLAGLIGTDKSLPAMEKAAASGRVAVRIAAAAAARHLPDEHRDSILLQLVDDADAGVKKVALKSAPAVMSDALKARVESLNKAAAKAPAVKQKSKKASKKVAPSRKKR
jgi:hypothetical protein